MRDERLATFSGHSSQIALLTNLAKAEEIRPQELLRHHDVRGRDLAIAYLDLRERHRALSRPLSAYLAKPSPLHSLSFTNPRLQQGLRHSSLSARSQTPFLLHSPSQVARQSAVQAIDPGSCAHLAALSRAARGGVSHFQVRIPCRGLTPATTSLRQGK